TETETDIIINNNKASYKRDIEGEDKSSPAHAKPKSFVIPTLEQVQAYCQERNNRVSAQRFYDHYESNGWKIGKNPMRDWKAAVRKWESNEYSNSKTEEPDPEIENYKKVINKFLY
ncbi:MAG: hypothetical protein J6Y64_06300, partial [Ruminococcus sp.]|nr:hypothetical protein [Ruminococcus sp.]